MNRNQTLVFINSLYGYMLVFTLEPEGEIPKLKDKIVCEKLMDFDISVTYVYNKLNNLDSSKSSGPDGVHSRILKEFSWELAKPLHYIFKASIKISKIPTDWRNANITAIHKKGDKK